MGVHVHVCKCMLFCAHICTQVCIRMCVCVIINEFVYHRLKDLLRSDGSIVVNDKSDQSKLQEQHSVNVSPNKEVRSDHTHWASGDDTDSDWASTPVICHDNRTTTRSPPGITMRKHAGTKRSLFSIDDSSSQEQEATRIVKKSMGILIICYIRCCFMYNIAGYVHIIILNYSRCYPV